MNNIIFNEGWDCAWIASDRHGHLAAFFSAGYGPILKQATQNNLLALENIESNLYALPTCSDSLLIISIPRPDDFIEICKRGFFVYDWRDASRTAQTPSNLYELVSQPKKPIIIDTLPEPLFNMASSIVFSDLTFAESMHIDVINEKINQ